MEYSPHNKININGTEISIENPCYIIAEIGINHNGKVSLAKKLVDVAVECGANAVKFQKRDLESIYKKEILENPNLDSQGTEILIGVLKEVELHEEDYKEIIEYCKEKGITFLCTPWDKKSVDFLEKYDVPAYKVASADMTNFPLIKHIADTKKPMIISTGMSTLEEIDKTVGFAKSLQSEFALLHCNSTYPSPVDLLNLKMIPFLRERFDVPIGYSGHEISIIPSLSAASMGAVIIERHITLDRKMEGLDHAASLEPNELRQLIEGIREAELASGKPEKKMTRGEILQREVLGKSLICAKTIEPGERFSEDHIEVKGPARGLSPQYYYDILNKIAKRKIEKGQYILDSDLV
ncbi:MAG: N-acetylneuraminate synthase family protein [Candidatus Nitrosotenuis sp.]